MKIITPIVFGLIFLAQTSIGQTVPQGMKYQAVARNLKGQIMANQDLQLKISLYSDQGPSEIGYVEIHKVNTNELGLFSLTIGEGIKRQGRFEDIPWSTNDIWMKVEIQTDDETDFITISNSKMLSVPYAFYAATAGELAESSGERGGPGDPYTKIWTLQANYLTDPQRDKLGTGDMADLVIVTNNIERMRVYKTGDIKIVNSLEIGRDLNVKKNVYLNTDTLVNPHLASYVPGETINFGNFTVEQESSTYLTGTLTVDKHTELNSSLNVDGLARVTNLTQSTTPANGALVVDGGTGIGKNLNVGGDFNLGGNATFAGLVHITDLTQSTSTTTGALVVDGGVGIGKRLNVGEGTKLGSTLDVLGATAINNTLNVSGITTITNTTQSTTKDNGALIVEGGLGLEKNLNVGGAANFGGAASFGGMVLISDLTQSTSTSTGALVVAGGVGIGKRLNVGEGTKLESTLDVLGITTITNTTQSTTKDDGALILEGGMGMEKNLNVGGATKLGNTLEVTGASTLNNTLNVSGIISLTNTTESTTIANGGLVVSGGTGIAKNLNVGGTTTLNKELIVKGTGAAGGHVATFENTTDGNGISIKVGAATPHNSNNFVTFLNSAGGVVGRIEGENGAADLANNNDYQLEIDFMIADIALASGEEAIAIAEEIQAGVSLAAASTSSTACVGLGACVTAPIPSLIVGEAANLVVKTANLVVASANLAATIARQITFENNTATQFGVTYQSGAGDYAEYLPKLNPEEKFSGGDIVGMKHGFITKNSDGAERIMVISHNPIVLGKLPADGREDLYEMVAFLGQVPTKVMGEVQPGDYILSNGYHNGFGVARNPKNMKIDDYKRILGVAWEGADKPTLNMVNVAVGLNTNDLTGVILQQADLIEQQAQDMEAMRDQINQTHAILAELVPGFKESIQNNPLYATEDPSPENRSGSDQSTQKVDKLNEIHIIEPGSGDIIYFKITRDQLEEGIKLAEDISARAGINMDTHPFWSRLHSDPSYKAEVLNDVEVKLEYAYHTHQQINESKGN